MSELTLFDRPTMDTAASRAAFEAFRAAPHKTLSYGLGVDSTAVLLDILRDPGSYGIAPDFSDFSVITALTGDEFGDTVDDVQRLVVPRIREAGIRFIQVARAGQLEGEGVDVVSDSREPGKLHARGRWTLMEELEVNGTVPQLAGGHVCSQKYKGWPIEEFQRQEFGDATVGKMFGYNADELSRAEKADRHQAKRDAEAGRKIFALDYPLVRKGWDRERVERFVAEQTGARMSKSYCAQCCYSGICASQPAHLARLRKFPDRAARVMRLEYVSMALNSRSSLYGVRREGPRSVADTLYTRVKDDGNEAALGEFAAELDRGDWAAYRIQRVYTAGRRPECKADHGDRCEKPDCRDRSIKGTVWRSVRTVTTGPRHQVASFLKNAADGWDKPIERDGQHGHGINRLRLRTRGPLHGTLEDFYVAAPAGVVDKARPGFRQVWDRVLHGAPS